MWEEAITSARGEMSTYTHSGIVIDTDTTAAKDASGLRVECWDNAGIVPGVVTHSITDADGRFEMELSSADVEDRFGDEDVILAFKVVKQALGGGQWDLLADTQDKQIWNVKGPVRSTRIFVDKSTALTEDITLEPFVVRGHLTHYDTGPKEGESVTAYDVRASGDVTLGSSPTDARGYYEIAYDGTDLGGKQLADRRHHHRPIRRPRRHRSPWAIAYVADPRRFRTPSIPARRSRHTSTW